MSHGADRTDTTWGVFGGVALLVWGLGGVFITI